METIFKYNLIEILNEINGEEDLIPYWIKLDLLDRGVPIEVDPLEVKNQRFAVRYGEISYIEHDNELVIKWSNKKT
ncbi:MAG: hypothetical protein ACRCWQ_02270 [Bacilli bacterium]